MIDAKTAIAYIPKQIGIVVIKTMKPSSKTKYALRTMLDLALHQDNGVSRVADIARRQHIPQKFLEQILLALKGGGLVASRRGAAGGYVLARAPAAVTVADIVNLTENSFHSVARMAEGQDPFGDIWTDVADYARKKLAAITLQDVRAKVLEQQRGGVSEYAI